MVAEVDQGKMCPVPHRRTLSNRAFRTIAGIAHGTGNMNATFSAQLIARTIAGAAAGTASDCRGGLWWSCTAKRIGQRDGKLPDPPAKHDHTGETGVDRAEVTRVKQQGRVDCADRDRAERARNAGEHETRRRLRSRWCCWRPLATRTPTTTDVYRFVDGLVAEMQIRS
jgi:hypothetical protein